MSVTSQPHAELERSQSVILGKQSYLSTLLRLIRMEIYKIPSPESCQKYCSA